MAIFPVSFCPLCRKHLGAYVQETNSTPPSFRPLRLRGGACGLRRNRRSCGDRNKTGSEHAGHPRSRQALDESTLDDFNINNFSDYLIQLPGITAGGSGPGQNTIYIRGGLYDAQSHHRRRCRLAPNVAPT